MLAVVVLDDKVGRKRRRAALAVAARPFQHVHRPLAPAQKPEFVQKQE